MSLIEEVKQHLKQLVREHQCLIEKNADDFEIKDLELSILQTEAQLRNLGVDFWYLKY